MNRIGKFAFMLAAAVCIDAGEASARRLFINGSDASNLGQADLRKVDVHIDANGDVYITAPHYELTTADKFIPLQEYWQSRTGAQGGPLERPDSYRQRPQHQPPGLLPKAGSEAPSGPQSPSSSQLMAPGAAQQKTKPTHQLPVPAETALSPPPPVDGNATAQGIEPGASPAH